MTAPQHPSARSERFAGLTRGAAGFLILAVAAVLVLVLIGTAATLPAVPTGIDDPGRAVRWGVPVARAVLDLSAVATAGLGLLPRLVGFDRPARSEPVLAPTRRLAVWTSLIWAVAALVSVVLLTVELGGPATPAGVWSYLAHLSAGKGLLLSAGCAAGSAVLAAMAIRHGERIPAELRFGLALFGLLPLPLTGHATDSHQHDVAMVALEVHVAAATTWAGGLAAVVLVLARHRGLLAEALPRLSAVATWCIFAIAVTGLVAGLIQLAASPVTSLPGSLFSTWYGLLLLAKLLCLMTVGMIAIPVRWRVLPAVAAGRRAPLALWCGWELLVLGAAFGVAVLLTGVAVVPR